MKKNWWKIATVLLLGYTIIISFIIPLSPGITTIFPNQLNVGDNTINITGYNTQFTKQNNITCRLEFEGKIVACSKDMTIINDHKLRFSIHIPEELPKKNVHFRFLSNQYNILVPESVTIINAKTNAKENYSNCPSVQKPLHLAVNFPNRFLLNETIRNLMFHVPMWFAMMFVLLISFINSIRYLNGFNIKYDIIANQAVKIGLLFAILGILTGALWAKFTWNEHTNLFTLSGWWADDVKLNGAAISTLIYIAYNILRNAIEDEHQKAKISAVYNIFAFILMLVFIMVLPRMYDSLHPGNGGNPAFSQYDLDNTLRLAFYPAVLGWVLLGIWALNLNVRINNLTHKLENEQ